MGMTTLLTLASMFGSLTSVTPPISYHTKLDIWMVACIVFVFGTLAEFTLVIMLKYYLPHLPLGWFHKLCIKARVSPPSSADLPDRTDIKISDRTKAWVSNQANVRQRTSTPVLNLSDQYQNKMKDHNGHTKHQTNTIDDDEESIPDEVLLDERKQMAEKVIKVIDKYSVIIFFISFSVFVGIYWYQLLKYFYNR